MTTQYIVLNESRHYGWVAGLIDIKNVKRLLKKESDVFYIFSISNSDPIKMKLHYPFDMYSCLCINKYKEDEFDIDDDYIIIIQDKEDNLTIIYK